MLRKPASGLDSPIMRAVNEIGDGWILLILWAAHNKVTRFDDFQRELGVARNILAERLRKLVEFGVMEKTPIAKGARRMEYVLTDKGLACEAMVRTLQEWGETWVMSADGSERRAAE